MSVRKDGIFFCKCVSETRQLLVKTSNLWVGFFPNEGLLMTLCLKIKCFSSLLGFYWFLVSL